MLSYLMFCTSLIFQGNDSVNVKLEYILNNKRVHSSDGLLQENTYLR